jgi:hypothetical protein
MKSHSQKMRIAEKLIHITNDLRDCYVNEYGKVPSWSGSIQDMYLLNTDAEIQNFLTNEDVEIHEDVFKMGIAFGVLILQKEITYKFFQKHGENLTCEHRNEMYETMQALIFDYITNGVFDAY